MIRPIFAETERYGEYSKPGEFIYDRPFQWGSRRIGPDLAREGGKNSHKWHFDHFLDPASITAGSIMPSYEHLYRPMNFSTIPARVNAVRLLGAPYGERVQNDAIGVAKEQAAQIVAELVQQGGPDKYTLRNGQEIDLAETKIIALIAYLQRLGTDLFAPPEGETGPPAAPAALPDQAPPSPPATGGEEPNQAAASRRP
jgi:cytochrome c oxidase cbb3-type subunit I/II